MLCEIRPTGCEKRAERRDATAPLPELIERHELVVEAAEVAEEVERDAFAFDVDRLEGPEAPQDLRRSLGGETSCRSPAVS